MGKIRKYGVFEKPPIPNQGVMQHVLGSALGQREKGVAVTFRCATKVLDDYQVA